MCEIKKEYYVRSIFFLYSTPGSPLTNLELPGRCVCDGLWAGLQHSPAIQDTLFQVYLFSVKPCCCRVASHAHYPHRADIGRGRVGAFLLLETCSRRNSRYFFKFICFQLNPAAAGSLPMLITLTERTSPGNRERYYYGRLAPEGMAIRGNGGLPGNCLAIPQDVTNKMKVTRRNVCFIN